MFTTLSSPARTVIAALAALLGAQPALAQSALASDEVVAGGPDDFLEVRHLVLRGSQEEIGAALTELAQRDLGTRPWPARDTLVTRVQERYFESVWPAHHARMRGVAAAFGGSLDDPDRNYSVLGYDLGDMFGCTVVFYPPEVTADGAPVMSRNLDFTTGTTKGLRPTAAVRATMSRPFVIESYPDEGYASLFTCCTDLLGAAFDGVNEAGLTVALLSDRELMNRYEMVPTGGLAVGLSEIQVPRFLLETCATADEAREALLELKQYYAFVPCHYLVGDASGASFVFEASPDRNRSFFLDRPGEPLVTTNFMLHRNPEPETLEAGGRKSSIGRYQAVCRVLDAADGALDRETMIAASRSAAFDGPGPPPQVPYAPNRTLWHALYLPRKRALSIDFYLGEEPGPDASAAPRIRRSGYLDFVLEE